MNGKHLDLESALVTVTDLARRAWPDEDPLSRTLRDPLLARLLEECGELAGALRNVDGRSLRPEKTGGMTAVHEEYGDVLTLLLRLADVYNINVIEALGISLHKFQQRVIKAEVRRMTVEERPHGR